MREAQNYEVISKRSMEHVGCNRREWTRIMRRKWNLLILVGNVFEHFVFFSSKIVWQKI